MACRIKRVILVLRLCVVQTNGRGSQECRWSVISSKYNTTAVVICVGFLLRNVHPLYYYYHTYIIVFLLLSRRVIVHGEHKRDVIVVGGGFTVGKIGSEGVSAFRAECLPATFRRTREYVHCQLVAWQRVRRAGALVHRVDAAWVEQVGFHIRARRCD